MGEIPNGEKAKLLDEHGRYVRVAWKQLNGWVEEADTVYTVPP